MKSDDCSDNCSHNQQESGCCESSCHVDKTKIYRLKQKDGKHVLEHQLKYGCHVSVQGGLLNALENNSKLYCCQVYLGSRQSYSCSNINKQQKREIVEFFETGKQHLSSFYVHCPLVAYSNLTRQDVIERSRTVVERELATISDLPAACVLHIGKACGHKNGLAQVIENLNDLDIPRTTLNKSLLLETAAGQGTEIGRTWEELRHIYEGVDDGSKIGLCVDTQHIFAAGMSDLRSYEGLISLFDNIDDINSKSINLIHLNDSDKIYESRVDRHQNLGLGYIWSEAEHREALMHLLDRLAEESIDVILETPDDGVLADLALLRDK